MNYKEALVHLKNHEYWCDFSWQDEMCKVAAEAVEKQIPKAPIYYINKINKRVTCVNGHNIPSVCEYGKMGYCPFCGQKLDWWNKEKRKNNEN